MNAKIQLGWAGLGLVTATLLFPVGASAQEATVEVAPPNIVVPTPLPPAAVPPQVPPPSAQPAQAQDSESSTPAPSHLRYRLEGGLDGNFTLVSPSANYGFGNYLRFGAQLTDWLDAQFETAVGTILFSWYARAALTVGFTPVHWFTVSVGPVVGYFASTGFLDTGPRISAGYAGVTLRTDFHIVNYRASSGRRHSFTLGIGADAGGSLGLGGSQSADPAVAAMFYLGYTAH